MRVETKAAIALTIAATLLGAGSAAARNETIRWRQDTPTGIAGYELHWGTASTSYGDVVDLSLPSAANGVYSATVSVPDGATVYMALRSYDGSGQRSPLSNQIVRYDGGSPDPDPDPDPPPPPPPPPPDPDPTPLLGVPGAPYLVYP